MKKDSTKLIYRNIDEKVLSELECENIKLKEIIFSLRKYFDIDDNLYDKILNEQGSNSLAKSIPFPNYLNILPTEIITKIANYLDTISLAQFSCIQRIYKIILSNDSLWCDRFINKCGPKKYLRMLNKYILNSASSPESWRNLYYKSENVDFKFKRSKLQIEEYHGHIGTVTCLQILSNNRIISGSDDGSMLLWTKCQPHHNVNFKPPPALPLVELACGNKRNEIDRSHLYSSIACGSYNIASRSYRRKIGSLQLCKSRTFHGHGGPIWCLSFNETTDQVYSGGYDETVKVWDLNTGNCTTTLRGHSGWVSSLELLSSQPSYSSSSTFLASASWDNTLRVWGLPKDREGGDLVRTLHAGQESGALLSMSCSPNGNQIVLGCCNSQIQSWDIESGRLTDWYLGHNKEVHAVQVSNKIILSASGDYSVKLWDSDTQKCTQTFHEHTGSVMTLQFDGDYRVMTGSYDKKVKVWDIRHAKRSVATISGQQAAVFCLQFDDEVLITGSADYMMRVFDIC